MSRMWGWPQMSWAVAFQKKRLLRRIRGRHSTVVDGTGEIATQDAKASFAEKSRQQRRGTRTSWRVRVPLLCSGFGGRERYGLAAGWHWHLASASPGRRVRHAPACPDTINCAELAAGSCTGSARSMRGLGRGDVQARFNSKSTGGTPVAPGTRRYGSRTSLRVKGTATVAWGVSSTIRIVAVSGSF